MRTYSVTCTGNRAIATRSDLPQLKIVFTGRSASEALGKLLNSLMQCDQFEIVLLIDPEMPALHVIEQAFPEDGVYEMSVFGQQAFRYVSVGWQ